MLIKDDMLWCDMVLALILWTNNMRTFCGFYSYTLAILTTTSMYAFATCHQQPQVGETDHTSSSS